MATPEEENTKAQEAADQAARLAEIDLLHAGIEPGSPAETEFLFRVKAFGIMGVQPPKPELKE